MAARFTFRRRTTVPGIARELLRCFADPKRWTKGTSARNADGASVAVDSLRAVCWCAYGAVVAAVELPSDRSRFCNAFDAAAGADLVDLNDDDGLPAVRRVLRKLAKPARRAA